MAYSPHIFFHEAGKFSSPAKKFAAKAFYFAANIDFFAYSAIIKLSEKFRVWEDYYVSVGL